MLRFFKIKEDKLIYKLLDKQKEFLEIPHNNALDVAIYQGGGTIVEAQSTATGITNYRSVNCHSIITIRRVL